MSEIILQCHQVSKHYKQANQSITVLDNISFALQRGESVAIVGSSGAGKSTLLNVLGGLDQASEGYVSLMGQRYEQLNRKELSLLRNQQLGFVYQFHHLLSEFSALENTAMPLLIRGMSKKAAFLQASTMLERIGLGHRLTHRPAALSGGERQRVAIARAIVGEPACVLMDEPTGNLDESTATQIQQLLQELNTQLGLCFIIVTHDMKVADAQQRKFVLHNGTLNECPI